MEEKLKILHLPMMYEWFDKIASGEKTTEYRQCSDHWNRLFETRHYDLVRFQRGFYKWYGANDLNQAKVWAIDLGERIE